MFDDTGAEYPVTVDPDATQTLLIPSNWPQDIQTIDVSGDTVVIGAPYEDSGATGINGDQSDTSATDAGAAYVFVKLGALWIQQAYIKASNSGAADHFAHSLALSGDRLVVGAWGEDDGGLHSGAAYVFHRSGGLWSQVALLKASDVDSWQLLGQDVAIDGDTLVAGSRGNGAYVYVWDGTSWSEQAKLTASNQESIDDFAVAVAVSGDTIAVGARTEQSLADGVGADQGDNSGSAVGAAYIFQRSDGVWSQSEYIKASHSDTGDGFGNAVDLDGDTLIVGAWYEASSASGVGGDELDSSLNGAGAAYIFQRTAGNWSQQAFLKASNPAANDKFGYAVAVSGDMAAVTGASLSAGTGIDGDQITPGVNGGAAYVFRRDGGTWAQQNFVKSSNQTVNGFGLMVGDIALDGERLAVIVAVDPFPGKAALVIDDLPTQWLNLGGSLHGFFGVNLLTGEGELTVGSSNTIRLQNAMPLAPAIVLVALDPVSPAPFKQGTLVPLPPLLNLATKTDSFGNLSLPFVWPAGIPVGTRFTVQAAVADPAAPAGAAISNALSGITQ